MWGMTLKAIGCLNAATSSGSPLAKAFVWATSSAIALAPAPEVAWYDDATTRFNVPKSCRGLSGMIEMIVVQFGFATIPRRLYWPIASGLISGTTSGMSGSIRNAEELSTTTAPEAHAAGANSLLRDAPAENRAMSIPLKASFESSSTGNSCPSNFSFLPTDRSDARSRRFWIGNFRSARIFRKTSPTAPVAPAMATLKRLPLIASPLQRCFLDGVSDPFAHLGRSDLFYPLALAVDVTRPVPVGEDLRDRPLDPGGLRWHVKGVF